MNCLLKNTLGIVVLVVSLSSISIYSMDIFDAAKTAILIELGNLLLQEQMLISKIFMAVLHCIGLLAMVI